MCEISKQTRKRLKRDQLLYDEGFHDGKRYAMTKRWISVEEGSPKANVEVYIAVNDGYFAVGYVDSDGDWWETFDGLVSGRVTHWMPIPKLPEVDE